jgi:hypothetical protein
MAILDLMSHILHRTLRRTHFERVYGSVVRQTAEWMNLAWFVITVPKQLQSSTFSSCFSSIVISNGDGSFEIPSTLGFSTFISIPYHFPISISLTIIPYSNLSSFASSTRSFAYFTVRIICPPILKSPKPSRASLTRYSLYTSLEWNHSQTAPSSNSHSSLHNSFVFLV